MQQRRCFLFFALVLCFGVALKAQMPTDNDSWKGRCAALARVDLEHLSPADKALTHGMSSASYTTFGFDRSTASQPAVACTMFYLGAIAAGSQGDASTAHDTAVLAALEIKAQHHQNPTFSESLTRMKMKAREITRPALLQAQEAGMMTAATTVPYTQTNTAALRRSSEFSGN